jgi:uroporphyrinogen decarboxylase
MAALEGRKLDRIPMMEIGFWPETIERWKNEGLPEDVDIHDYFGLDKVEFFTYNGSLGLEEKTLKENEDSRTYIDGDGCTYKRFKNKQVTPHFISSSVKGLEDWENVRGHLKPDFKRFEDMRVEPIFGTALEKSQEEKYQECRTQETFTVIVPTEPCWYYLRLIGGEEALVNMAIEPEFVEQVIADYNDFNIKMIDLIYSKGYKFDAVWVFSDLCYKNGMLFSPKFFRERVLPYQKKFFEHCKAKGMKVIYHCCGNIQNFLPLLIETGIDCIQPMEARAGNDVVEYSQKYGDKISFMGNINSDVLASNKEAIKDEVSRKICELKQTQRYIFHSDHSLPPTISFENYCYTVGLAKELGKY